MLSSVFFQASEDFLFFIHGLLRKAIKVKSSSKKGEKKGKLAQDLFLLLLIILLKQRIVLPISHFLHPRCNVRITCPDEQMTIEISIKNS